MARTRRAKHKINTISIVLIVLLSVLIAGLTFFYLKTANEREDVVLIGETVFYSNKPIGEVSKIEKSWKLEVTVALCDKAVVHAGDKLYIDNVCIGSVHKITEANCIVY